MRREGRRSSAAAQPEATCLGKEALPALVAKTVAARMRRRRSEPVHPYPCPVCGHWHVGRSH